MGSMIWGFEPWWNEPLPWPVGAAREEVPVVKDSKGSEGGVAGGSRETTERPSDGNRDDVERPG